MSVFPDDIRKREDGNFETDMEVLCDANDDLIQICEDRPGGMVFELANGIKIIAPDDWA